MRSIFLPGQSLKTRLTVATLGIFLAGIWSLFLFTTQVLQDDMEHQLGEQQFSTVTYMADEINAQLDGRIKALETIARAVDSPLLENTAALQQFLAQRFVLHSLFNAGVRAYGADGTVTVSVPYSTTEIGVNYMDRDYLVGAIAGGTPSIGQPVVSKVGKLPVIVIAVPLRDAAGRVVGALAGITNLSSPSFFDRISGNRYGKTGGYLLVDPKHRLIITATDKSRIMERSAAPGLNPVTDRFHEGYEGYGVYVNPRGVEVLSANKVIPIAGWNIVLNLPTEEAFAPIRDMQLRLVLATLFLTLVAGVLTWWVVKRQLSPVLQTVDTLAAMSDNSQPLHALAVARDDEIGQLVGSFNRLLEALALRETALRESEAKLRESEFFLRESQQIGQIGGWRASPAKNSVTWTEGVYAIAEFSSEDKPDLETALDAYLPESRVRVVESLANVLRTGEPFVIQVEVQGRQSGQHKWAELRGFPHFDADGGIDYVMGTLQDISRLKQTEIELNNYRWRLEELVAERTTRLEAANQRLLMSDMRLNALFEMSQRASTMDEAELLQLGIDEAVRLTGSEIGYLHFVNDDQETIRLSAWSTGTLKSCSAVHDLHYPISEAGVWADSARSRCAIMHNDYQRMVGGKGYPEGHVHLIRHIGVPVIESDKVKMLLGVGNKAIDYDESDLRELQLIGDDLWRIYIRRHAELQLVEAKEAAESANRAKSTFLANMSHEIRTPLNGIVGMANILRRAGVTPAQAERLGKIDTSAAHLLGIINDILDISKIEAGKFELEEAPVAINRLLTNISHILAERAQASHIGLIIDADSFPDGLYGDPIRLQQALLNYATNALKFTETGRVVLRAIKIHEDDTRLVARFEVEDTGLGIPADDLARIFDAFEQADSSTTRKYGGTGLGLTITRRLVTLMGGDVGAESTPGVGSIFWFTVPLAKRGVAGTVTPSIPSADAEAQIRERHRGQRVLLVDDEPVNLEIAAFLLEATGLVVDTADDGDKAVERASRGGYAVILMDMQMPNRDGLDATRAIRQIDACKDVPIVAMTANAFAEDRGRCFSAGMNDFIAKPFEPEVLFATLLKWLDAVRTPAEIGEHHVH